MIKRTPLTGLWLTALFACTASACVEPDTDTRLPQADGIIVQCASKLTPAQCQAALARHQVEVIKSLGRPGLFLVMPPKNQSDAALLETMRQDPALKYAEPNRKVGR